MNEVIRFLDTLPGLLPWSIRAIMGLVTVDVLLGIARAIRLKEFKWQRMAAFYRTMVVPYIIGYVAVIAAAKFIGEATLPEPYGFIVSASMIGLAWVSLVGTLARSCWTNARELWSGIPESQRYFDEIDGDEHFTEK